MLNLPAMRETLARSLGWEDPLEKGKATRLQYSGPENSMDCIVHGVAKSWTRLSDFHFTDGSVGKEIACSAEDTGDLGSIPGLGRSPGEGNGNPLQYSRLKNSMDRGAWQATVHGVAKSWTQLSD